MANVTPLLVFQSAQEIEEFGGSWTDVQNALAFDGLEAFSQGVGFSSLATQTNLLRTTQAQIGDALPALEAFVLLGVEVEVRGRWTGSSDGARSVNMEAVVGGSVRASLGSGSLPLETPGVFVLGGAGNPMNLTPEDFFDPTFGFQLRGSSSTFHTQGNSLRIDSVRFVVHWDDPPQPPEGGARSRLRTREALTRGVLA